METGKAMALFILGLLLALATFLTAWSVSAGLRIYIRNYINCLEMYLIAKREGRKLPLVLGIILLVVAIPSLLGTAHPHGTMGC